MRLLMVIFVVAIAGCVSNLDEKMLAVQEQAQTGDAILSAAGRKFIDCAGQMADDKHNLQEEVVQATWNNWVVTNTDATTGRVNVDAKVLLAEVNKRDVAMSKAAKSRRTWAEAVSVYLKVLDAGDAMHNAVWTEAGKVMDAKKSAQAVITQALTALGSLGSGLGIGIAVAP